MCTKTKGFDYIYQLHCCWFISLFRILLCIHMWSDVYLCDLIHVIYIWGICYTTLVCQMVSFLGLYSVGEAWSPPFFSSFIVKLPLVTVILSYVTIKQAWPQWFYGRTGFTPFVRGGPYETHIHHSVLIAWLRVHHETISNEGICNEETMWAYYEKETQCWWSIFLSVKI